MEQIWRNKEARMKELEELERMKCSLVFDSEDENEEPEEKEKKIEEKVVKCQEEVVDFETALAAVIKPFNLLTMDVDDLKKKAKELYDIAVKMIVDKCMFEELIKEQRQKLEDLNEQLDEKMRAKHAKKGVDMHKFYPTKRVHPPKMSIFSKFDKRKGERNYDERKEMYDTGCNGARPKMLENMWEQKITAYLNDNISHIIGAKSDDELSDFDE